MISYTRIFSILCAIFALSSCGSFSSKKKVSTKLERPVVLSSAMTPKNLNLQTACALAVRHHASLATYPMDRRAADARILRATRLPNPELSIEAEDILGVGAMRGLSSGILNVIFSQLVERGGKRQARIQAAQSEGLVLDSEYELKRTELIKQTSELYIMALAAHEDVEFLKASHQRAKQTLELVNELSNAGSVTASAVQQSELEANKLQLDLATAKKKKEKLARELTAMWGDSRSALFSYDLLAPPPRNLASKVTQQKGLARHPRIRLASSQLEAAKSEVALARSHTSRDIAVFGGPSANNESNSVSGKLGISLPLPIFNKGRDNLVEKQALAQKAATQLSGAQRELNAQFSIAWAELKAAHAEARVVQQKLLPTASKLFKNAEASYRAGKISSLEFLAAKQQFHEIRRRWLSSRLDYQLAAIRVQTLTNRPL